MLYTAKAQTYSTNLSLKNKLLLRLKHWHPKFEVNKKIIMLFQLAIGKNLGA